MKNNHIESFKRLQHILEAVSDIQKYVDNETKETFCEKGVLHDAVLFQFSVIGEAINHVEIEKLEKYKYPWYKVRSFRNMIAHEYFNIKIPAVWEIIVNDLPLLEKMIKKILEKEF